ncbi:MAG: LysE family translocator [Pseudomonadota bacterium]
MTVTAWELTLYAGSVAVLFLTPGPVWVAIVARGVSGGFHGAWPLALGVVVGDALWPLAAIYGLTWITSVYAGFIDALRWVAVAIFVAMGMGLIRHAGHAISADARLTRPGVAAGFLAGVAVILGNPKAILFYMVVLPGFFDMSGLTGPDVAAIVAVSMAVPLGGNLILALFLGRTRQLLASPERLRRLNLASGGLLIAVGAAIAVS